jgi:hypothetical protein
MQFIRCFRFIVDVLNVEFLMLFVNLALKHDRNMDFPSNANFKIVKMMHFPNISETNLIHSLF